MSETICSVSGCNNQVYARGWCRNHYQKWRRCGDTGDHKKNVGYAHIQDAIGHIIQGDIAICIIKEYGGMTM